MVLDGTPACFRGCYFEDHPRTGGYMFNNYDDRFSRVVGSLANGLFMVYKWGY